MPKNEGEITRERILQVAEKLFSEIGFDGTGVDKIAKNAGINKGSIYYHFKDKDDILDSLFQNIIEDMEAHVNKLAGNKAANTDEIGIEEKIKSEIKYLSRKKSVLAILLMETLKVEKQTDYFFKYADMMIREELNTVLDNPKTVELSEEEIQKFMVYEFFTGMIPVISYIVLKDKWCEYFRLNEEKLFEYFMEAFVHTHIKTKEL